MKIEVIYKNDKGEIVDKKDLPKNVRLSTPRIKSLIKDEYGFEYKSKKSKSSEVKSYFGEPIKKEKVFHYSEDDNFIKTENDKYSIIFNKKNSNAEICSVIPVALSKGFVEGRKAHIKTISLEIEDIQSVKEDKDLLDVLVETN